MSGAALILLGIHLIVLSALINDRFRTVDMWADILELHVLPSWFRWDNRGDPVSWVQHGLIAGVVSLYGGALSVLTPETFVTGAMIGGWVAFSGYMIREGTDLSFDSIMDRVGPLLVAVFWTLL